jgi:hypothetical protein
MDTTAFIVTNVAWLLIAGVAAFRTLRYERRRQKLIVAVVEAIPPGGRVEEHRPDGTRLIVTTMAPPSRLRSHLKQALGRCSKLRPEG